MHEAALPFLNLAILGSFMALSMFDAKQTESGASDEAHKDS